MNGQLSQADRIAEFSTPLGKDVLALTSYSGSEGLGELFEYHIEAISQQENVDFDPAIGRNCQVKLKAYHGKIRIFNGVMTEARWIGKTDDFFQYQMVLRPWFWLLGHRADCRIFLDKSVKEIIEDVFTKAGFSDFEFRTTGDYSRIEYCVQYRETDLAFCCRLMEHYGIYYFFEHSDGKHTMVLADSRTSHKPIPDLPTVPLIPLFGSELRLDQHLQDWTSERRFRAGKVQYNDYDYLHPKKDLKAPKEASEKYAHASFEVYDYPGKYDDRDKGQGSAGVRLEAEQSFDHRRIANGHAPSLYPGGLVTAERHATASENQEYLIVHASHNYSSEHYRTGHGGGEAEVYHGAYEFLPCQRPFRMLPKTPRPRIYGIQTAKVVGKKGEEGEEISTDELGRIWVQFYWDRGPSLTCPIRVAQMWAGNKWGAMFIPRVGMEVVVDFLEGDPDKPLVTGCVYNGDNKPPWELPKKKNRAGFWTDSTKGHGGENLLAFDDTKGSEFIGVVAQKMYYESIRDGQHTEIGRAFTGTARKGTYPESRLTTLLNGDDRLDIENGNQNVHVSKDQNIKVDKKITIEAGVEITLKVGKNSITIDNAGIKLDSAGTVQIDGVNVEINSTATMKISHNLEVKGAVIAAILLNTQELETLRREKAD